VTDDAATPPGADAPPAEAAHPLGRGRKWAEGIPAQVVAFGRDGLSRAEIAAALERSLETFDHWEASNAKFRDALAQARTLSLAWWERKGREGIESGKLNATLWGRNMAGRFPELYGERAAAEAARKASKPRTPKKPITDFERAKIVATLMAEHPAAFAHLLPPAPLAVAAGLVPSDG
jgi:hypothetical protein